MNAVRLKARLRRDIECSTGALVQTEVLCRVLRDAAVEHPNNFYVASALASAQRLNAEMEGDLEHAIERAVAAGFDPEDFE